MITVKITDVPADLRIDRGEIRRSVGQGDGSGPLTRGNLRSAWQYLDCVRTSALLPSRHVKATPAPRLRAKDYPLVCAGWELTEACNMRCRHCLGAAGRRTPDELSTRQALRLCDQLSDLGVRSVALSGGEPLLRPDWPKITQRLTRRNVYVGITSNAAEPMYVAISNANGAPAVAANADPAAATMDTWTEWLIPLQAFADQGVNLSDVDSIAIGLGTTSGMASLGGSGTVYFDDIRLYP